MSEQFDRLGLAEFVKLPLHYCQELTMLQELTYTQNELSEFAAHLTRLQEQIEFFQRELDRGHCPDMEPIIKLMNCLVDIYS